MKKAISIPFLVAATLILFCLSIIPHHHHEGVPCFRTEHHENGKTTPNEHAGDPTTPNADHDPLCCCTGTNYTISTADQRTKEHITFWSNKENDYQGVFTPASLFAVSNHELASSLFSLSLFQYREHPILFYHSADIRRLNGLRAPPSFS